MGLVGTSFVRCHLNAMRLTIARAISAPGPSIFTDSLWMICFTSGDAPLWRRLPQVAPFIQILNNSQLRRGRRIRTLETNHPFSPEPSEPEDKVKILPKYPTDNTPLTLPGSHRNSPPGGTHLSSLTQSHPGGTILRTWAQSLRPMETIVRFMPPTYFCFHTPRGYAGA